MRVQLKKYVAADVGHKEGYKFLKVLPTRDSTHLCWSDKEEDAILFNDAVESCYQAAMAHAFQPHSIAVTIEF